MTAPSKLTDAELRLAIAEELGWKPSSVPGEFIWERPEDGLYDFIPNYPGDPAAALGLLDGIAGEVCLTRDIIGNWGCAIHPGPNPENIYVGTGDKLARAICEAWLKAKENDENK